MPAALTCKKTVDVLPVEIQPGTYRGQHIRKFFRFRDSNNQLHDCTCATDAGASWVSGNVVVTESSITFTADE